jgi:hypothetical protein
VADVLLGVREAEAPRELLVKPPLEVSLRLVLAMQSVPYAVVKGIDDPPGVALSFSCKPLIVWILRVTDQNFQNIISKIVSPPFVANAPICDFTKLTTSPKVLALRAVRSSPLIWDFSSPKLR